MNSLTLRLGAYPLFLNLSSSSTASPFLVYALMSYLPRYIQEDDEQTIEEDEALITEEERQEELAALQNEVELPLEELLKRYSMIEGI